MKKTLEHIQSLLSLSDPVLFWNELVAYGKQIETHGYWDYFSRYDLLSEIRNISEYIGSSLKKDYIPFTVVNLSFGLFESFNEDNIPLAGFYICGSNRDETEPEFLCDPEWFPEWGYIDSVLLNEIVLASRGLLFYKKDDIIEANVPQKFFDMFGYYFLFGAAIAVVKGVLNVHPMEKNVFVGFDSGDILKVQSI